MIPNMDRGCESAGQVLEDQQMDRGHGYSPAVRELEFEELAPLPGVIVEEHDDLAEGERARGGVAGQNSVADLELRKG